MPKSYLSDAERQELMEERVSENTLYAIEAQEATKADDSETAWAWLALAEIPAHTLLALKRVEGADYIRARGLRTESAEAAYGKDWLDREI